MKCTFASVGSEKKNHILLKVKVQLFVFIFLFFLMSQLDTNGCLIFFDYFFFKNLLRAIIVCVRLSIGL